MKQRLVMWSVACALANGLVSCITGLANMGIDDTRAGKLLFDYTNAHVGVATEAVRTAFAFNGYYRQTTPKEREEMHDRYFYKSRIVDQDSVWLILNNSGVDWTIRMNDGMPLGEQGAVWKLWCMRVGDKKPMLTCDLLHDEKITCRIYEDGLFESTSEWTVTPKFDPFISVIECGSGVLLWHLPPKMTIRYDIVKPLLCDDAADCISTGTLMITSSIPEEGIRDIVNAEYDGQWVQITYGDHTYAWDIDEDYMGDTVNEVK